MDAATTLHSTLFGVKYLVFNVLQNVECLPALHSLYIHSTQFSSDCPIQFATDCSIQFSTDCPIQFATDCPIQLRTDLGITKS